MVVTVIKCIGLALGMCLWGMANLLVGWFSGTFGLFGLNKEDVPKPLLNYFGFVLATFSIFVFLFIKPEVKQVSEDDSEEKNTINFKWWRRRSRKKKKKKDFIENLAVGQKRILGISLALISGVFYGTNFDPPQYVQDHGGSQEGLDYVFFHISLEFLLHLLLTF